MRYIDEHGDTGKVSAEQAQHLVRSKQADITTDTQGTAILFLSIPASEIT